MNVETSLLAPHNSIDTAKIEPAFPVHHSNINLLWASLLIEELIRHGIRDFCIAPGSRSTPLTLAIANHSKAITHIHFDERGLGFLALGLTQASQKPVVIVATSGSAVANLYPAVIEARQSGLPLVVLSADRPAELLNCGANQAIDQHAIFANYPIFFAQIIQPTTDVKANYLLTTLDQGLSKQNKYPAPIHFNLTFSEPLYPTNEQVDYQQYLSTLKPWMNNNIPFTQVINTQGSILPVCSPLDGKRVLIIVAKLQDKKEAQAITMFCSKHHFVLLTDIQSSQHGVTNNLSYYDLLLGNTHFNALLQQADIIIQFGESLICKALSIFMDQFQGELQLVSAGDTRIDPNHQLDQRFNCTPTQWIAAQCPLPSEKHQQWHSALQKCHDHLSQKVIAPFIALQPYSEIAIVNELDQLIKQEAPLFISNSMPIRLANMLMVNNQARIFTNRGASGIDGLLATAIGVAHNNHQPSTLLIGDTSFLYDLNSLALLKSLQSSFIIILINNDGGAIFNLLPVPQSHKKEFYQLPHGLNFKASCEQFNIKYYNPHQITDFKETYNRCLQNKHSLIEITLPNQQTATQLQQLKEQIKDATI